MRTLLHSHAVRKEYGLLVNDSLVAAAAALSGIQALASADADFERVTELETYEPGGLKG